MAASCGGGAWGSLRPRGGSEAELSLRHVGPATPLTCQRRQHRALSCAPQGQSPAPLGQKSQGKERTAGLCQAPARLGEDELRRRTTERSGGAQVDILDSQTGQAERRGVSLSQRGYNYLMSILIWEGAASTWGRGELCFVHCSIICTSND